MCVKLNSLFDIEVNVYEVTQVIDQGINIITNCPNYILELRNTNVTFIGSLSRRVGQDRN